MECGNRPGICFIYKGLKYLKMNTVVYFTSELRRIVRSKK